jgi:hypothetical protein
MLIIISIPYSIFLVMHTAWLSGFIAAAWPNCALHMIGTSFRDYYPEIMIYFQFLFYLHDFTWTSILSIFPHRVTSFGIYTWEITLEIHSNPSALADAGAICMDPVSFVLRCNVMPWSMITLQKTALILNLLQIVFDVCGSIWIMPSPSVYTWPDRLLLAHDRLHLNPLKRPVLG